MCSTLVSCGCFKCVVLINLTLTLTPTNCCRFYMLSRPKNLRQSKAVQTLLFTPHWAETPTLSNSSDKYHALTVGLVFQSLKRPCSCFEFNLTSRMALCCPVPLLSFIEGFFPQTLLFETWYWVISVNSSQTGSWWIKEITGSCSRQQNISFVYICWVHYFGQEKYRCSVFVWQRLSPDCEDQIRVILQESALDYRLDPQLQIHCTQEVHTLLLPLNISLLTYILWILIIGVSNWNTVNDVILCFWASRNRHLHYIDN